MASTSSAMASNSSTVAIGYVFDDEEHMKEYNAKRRGQCFTETQLSRNDDMRYATKLRDRNHTLDEIAPTNGIKALMVCAYCKKLPMPPIALCLKGHILCHDCAAKLGGCTYGSDNAYGMCGASMAPVEIQLYKYLVDNSSLNCPYANIGCKEKVRGTALATHLEVCKYRDSIRCPCSDCGTIRISPRMYLAHLNIDHGAQMLQGPTHKVQICHVRKLLYSELVGDYRWIAAVIRYDDLDFLFVVQEACNEVFMWLHYVNHELDVDGRQIMVKFSIFNPRTKKVDYTWSGDIAPKKKIMDRIPRSEYCFSVHKIRLESDYLFQLPDDKKYYYNVDLTIFPFPMANHNH